MRKTIKIKESADRIYLIGDKVTGTTNASFIAKNDNDMVRMLVFMDYFKTQRLQDTVIVNTGILVEGLDTVKGMSPKKVNIMECLKELSIEMEKPAEKIEGEKKEVKKAIQNGNIVTEKAKGLESEVKTE